MLQNAYLLAKIGADTAENERNFAEHLPIIGNYPTDTVLGGEDQVELLSNEVTSNDAVIQAHGKITMDKNDEKTVSSSLSSLSVPSECLQKNHRQTVYKNTVNHS